MTDNPEALQLAYELDKIDLRPPINKDAAAELRRLHALNAELVEALRRLYGNAKWINDEQAIVRYDDMLDARDALAKTEASK